MADYLAPKTASEVVKRVWSIPVDGDDGATSVSLSATGITVDNGSGNGALEGNDLILTLSGGTAAATANIVATITTDESRTLIETLYIPIIDSAAQVADTARSYIGFALRKVAGIGEVVTAEELTDALEQLEAMLAEWRAGGAEIGATSPLTADTVIYCPDWAVNAIRYNLRVNCAGLYDLQLTPMDVERARRGLQLIKHTNLPNKREVEFY